MTVFVTAVTELPVQDSWMHRRGCSGCLWPGPGKDLCREYGDRSGTYKSTGAFVGISYVELQELLQVTWPPCTLFHVRARMYTFMIMYVYIYVYHMYIYIYTPS